MIDPITGLLGGAAAWWFAARRQAQQLDDPNDGTVAIMYNPGVIRFAQAIARQEGFGVDGALPTICNNPGDLADPSGTLFHLPTRGPEAIVEFPDAPTGWDALYRQLQRIADGQSHVYTLGMTIAQMAEHYAPKPDPTVWAANVAAFAGYTTDTTLSEVLS